MVLDYYPFGLKHKGYNNIINGTDHPYGYNGKEENDALGFNMLEMDVRQFDPAIARWTSIDPITHHQFSTYSGFDNNPIYFADPSGAYSEVSEDGNRFTFTGADARDVFRMLKANMGSDENEEENDEDCCKDFFDKMYGKSFMDLDFFGSRDYWLGEDGFTYWIKNDKDFYRLRRDGDEKVEELPPMMNYIDFTPGVGGNGRNGLTLLKTGSKVNLVYIAREGGKVIYVGITNNYARRALQHLRGPHKLKINPMSDSLQKLTRSDARAVEQVLIEYFGLGGKRGQTGQLLNRINSISENNKMYGEALKKGKQLLEKAGFNF